MNILHAQLVFNHQREVNAPFFLAYVNLDTTAGPGAFRFRDHGDLSLNSAFGRLGLGFGRLKKRNLRVADPVASSIRMPRDSAVVEVIAAEDCRPTVRTFGLLRPRSLNTLTRSLLHSTCMSLFYRTKSTHLDGCVDVHAFMQCKNEPSLALMLAWEGTNDGGFWEQY